MITKKIATAVLALAVLGAASAPALARHDDYRTDRNGRRIYERDRRVNRDRIGARNQDRKEELDARADRLRERIRTLHANGRLSRDHHDRALDKLQRIRQDVRSNERVDEQRYQANMRWLDSVERDVENWSSGDSRSNRNSRVNRNGRRIFR